MTEYTHRSARSLNMPSIIIVIIVAALSSAATSTTDAFIIPSTMHHRNRHRLITTIMPHDQSGLMRSRFQNPSSMTKLRYQNGTMTDDIISTPLLPKRLDTTTDTTNDDNTPQSQQSRFDRQAAMETSSQKECILEIHGRRYNMTAWVNAHPGGAKILHRFHDKNATKAFDAAGHSKEAYEMLQQFVIPDGDETTTPTIPTTPTTPQRFHRIRHKLFTREDPIGIHKYLGIICLLNFIGRYQQMLLTTTNPTAGLARRGGFAFVCLFAHAMLSLSSLIFHTVPKERVVGKPMIWQEFRMHNIIFGVRSVISAMVTSVALWYPQQHAIRAVAIWVASLSVVGANVLADIATDKLRSNEMESTTATMPYWDGCSVATQKRFKSFYAYCQFMASLSCLAVSNPAWPLAVLLPIQLASLLMTLVRKGLIGARAYHYGYTAALIMPWIVGIRHTFIMQSPDIVGMALLGYAAYKLRRKGVSKYALWIPIAAARILVGDSFINYAAW